MKKIKKSEAPENLIQYLKNNPNNTWENFKDELPKDYKSLIDQIKKDQGGLCCYCETNFHEKLSPHVDDFRVEHFHPKSDSNTHKNWHLDWNNLLGCCHGGSKEHLHNKSKFIPEHEERHSDILKGENNWDDKILNPLLDIPAFPPLFKINNNGRMEIIEENCTYIRNKALNCLNPEILNLNTDKLIEFRKFVIDVLREELNEKITNGLEIKDAIDIIVNSHLSKKDDYYSPFFSTIRSFFKNDAEVFLKSINFNG